MECLIDKLCAANPASVRTGSTTVKRWTLVCNAYRNIRDKVINNAKVMDGTRIQLLEINNTTPGVWFNKKQKAQEQKMLTQGIVLPTLPRAAPESLPPLL